MEFAFRTTGSFIRYATSRRASSVFSHTIFPSREANTTPPELLKQIPTLHISYIIKVPFLKLITTVKSYFKDDRNEIYQWRPWGSLEVGGGGRNMVVSTATSGAWTLALPAYSSFASSRIDSTKPKSSSRQRNNTEGSFNRSRHCNNSRDKNEIAIRHKITTR